MNHRLVPPTAHQAGKPPAWPSYKGTSQRIGVSTSGKAIADHSWRSLPSGGYFMAGIDQHAGEVR